MIKKLLEYTFDKLLHEHNNNNKTVNGCFVFFVNVVLEERHGVPRLISERTLINYYRKFVEGKPNKSGEPSSELKDHMAVYLGYKNYTDFELKHLMKHNQNFHKRNLRTKFMPYIKVPLLLFFSLVYPVKLKNCIPINKNNCLYENCLNTSYVKNHTQNHLTSYQINITGAHGIQILSEARNNGFALVFRDLKNTAAKDSYTDSE